MVVDNQTLEVKVAAASSLLDSALQEMGKRIVGQKGIGQRLLMALIVEGHVLLEGLPGLAKTTFVKTAAEICRLAFRRIQFTPDLLPADIIGTQIYQPKSGEFYVKHGPIFANLVLADEVNRAPPKVQSALLEVMEERQVTIGDQTYAMERPFLVLATQNPIEQEGTYPLPEAQADRFLFKLKLGYGSMEEEQEIVARAMAGDSHFSLSSVLSADDLKSMGELIRHIKVVDKVRRYITEIVFATRDPASYGFADLAPLIDYGASPRASINLEKAARANALFQGRTYVSPQDVKDVALDVIRHRIVLSYQAEADGQDPDKILKRIISGIDVP